MKNVRVTLSLGVLALATVTAMAQETTKNTEQPPTLGLILVLAIVAAIFDWNYKRKGGKKPTPKDRGMFGLACGFALLVLLWWGLVWDASAEFIGRLTAFLVMILFSAWEFARWRVRRKNPIVKAGGLMFCNQCGTPNSNVARFCSKCGAQLPRED